VHRICPNYYTKQIDAVNARFDNAIALVKDCEPAIAALNSARAIELAEVNERAALSRIGSVP
jgi:hypothetical protein